MDLWITPFRFMWYMWRRSLAHLWYNTDASAAYGFLILFVCVCICFFFGICFVHYVYSCPNMHSFWINANELNFDVRHIHTDTGNVLHMMFYYVHACMQILMYIARLCVPFSIGFLADCLHTKNAAETRHQNTHIRFYSNFNTQTTSCVNIEWECSQPLWFYLPIWNGNIAWKPAKCAKFSAAHIAFIIHNEHCHLYPQQQSCVL